MICPFCGGMDSRVVDSRTVEEGVFIRRRRECISCDNRFTTMEKVEEHPIMVIKRDGRREIFDGNKILSGLLRAAEKRNIPTEELQQMVRELEQELRTTYVYEVDADQIGAILLNKLRRLDEVAYVRFASVFNQFQNIETFKEELEKMIAMRETDRDSKGSG